MKALHDRYELLLIVFVALLPLSVAYRHGAEVDSCYDHKVNHSIPFGPSIVKINCEEPCKFDLILLGKVDPVTLDVVDTNINSFECEVVYKFTLTSSSPFIGFLIQARAGSTFQRESLIWGEWLETDDANYKPLGCKRSELTDDATIYQNSATHANPFDKNSVSFYWRAPTRLEYDTEIQEDIELNIFYTIVVDFATIFNPLSTVPMTLTCPRLEDVSPSSTAVTSSSFGTTSSPTISTTTRPRGIEVSCFKKTCYGPVTFDFFQYSTSTHPDCCITGSIYFAIPGLEGCIECFSGSQTRGQAPGDHASQCRAEPFAQQHIFPAEVKILLDTYDYYNLFSGLDSRWISIDEDRDGNSWQQRDGGNCQWALRACSGQPEQDNWLFSQYIFYGGANEILLNVSYSFAECVSACTKNYVTLYSFQKFTYRVQQRINSSNYLPLFGDIESSRLQQPQNSSAHVSESLSFLRPNDSIGFFLGIRDEGTCGQVGRLIAHYLVCPHRVDGLVVYPEMALPPQNFPDIIYDAECVDNAENTTSLQVRASSNGSCTALASGRPACRCEAGFELSRDGTSCRALMLPSIAISGNGPAAVTPRVGCRVVVQCSGQGSSIVWRRFGLRQTLESEGNRNITTSMIETEYAGIFSLISHLVFDPVFLMDTGFYTCSIDSRTSTVNLRVNTEPATIRASNFDLSNFIIGDVLTIRCPVESCVENLQVHLYRGSDLLDTITVLNPTTQVARFRLEATEDLAGEYICQAMGTLMAVPFSFNATFNIRGTPRDPPTPAPPLRVDLINGSPRITKDSVSVDFESNQRVKSSCLLRSYGSSSSFQRRLDCSKGRVQFLGLAEGNYILRIISYSARVRVVVRRKLTIGPCAVHLINKGITVEQGTATIEFTGTEDITGYRCRLGNAQHFVPCQSPLRYMSLTTGRHRLRVQPLGCDGERLIVDINIPLRQ